MEKISENVIKIIKDEKEIYLVGTAHVLKESKEEVEKIINLVDPDIVCVELCESRYESLKEKERWKNLDIIEVIRNGQGFLLFITMILSSFQKKIGLNLDSTPGDEMIIAIELAKIKDRKVIFADRDINITLKRAWGLSSFKDKINIINILLLSILFGEEVEEKEIKELLKGEDLINELMDYLSKKLPAVKRVLIDERNLFIADKILNSGGKKIVAVIGKGHLSGIQKILESDFSIDNSINEIPKPKITSKIIQWVILGIIMILFILGFIKGKSVGISMILTWILVTGTCTAISTLIAFAHPITILSSWIIAPLTTLNPTLGAGIFLALIESFFHKPRVLDFENLHNDILSFRGFIKNRVSKILLVFVLSSIGASIGTFVALPWITTYLK